MEFTGKVIAVLPLRSGTSARGEWKSQSFVVEDAVSGQYPRKLCFDVWGEDKLQQFNIQMGQTLTVSFDIDAHEYQGRWFNSIRAWRVVPATEGVAPAPASTPVPPPAPAATADFGTS
ncbi:MAG: DUF3127 domain-containing protein, partial [Prevotellaceae bacterium]|nr:DUF3127 domain-containing protein [Prevotellaceae bacterium]